MSEVACEIDADRDSAAAGVPRSEREFRDLVVAHRKSLQAFVLRRIGNAGDAEDLTQQAFFEASRTISTFRGESAFSTWLYGIAMNLVRNHLSRAPHRRFRFEDEGALDRVACHAAGPEERLAGVERLSALERQLAALPDEMRQVLWLVAVDELSYEDAAVMLSVPIGTVRSRVSRARSTLRTRLAAVGVDV